MSKRDSYIRSSEATYTKKVHCSVIHNITKLKMTKKVKNSKNVDINVREATVVYDNMYKSQHRMLNRRNQTPKPTHATIPFIKNM